MGCGSPPVPTVATRSDLSRWAVCCRPQSFVVSISTTTLDLRIDSGKTPPRRCSRGAIRQGRTRLDFWTVHRGCGRDATTGSYRFAHALMPQGSSPISLMYVECTVNGAARRRGATLDGSSSYPPGGLTGENRAGRGRQVGVSPPVPLGIGLNTTRFTTGCFACFAERVFPSCWASAGTFLR